MNPENDLLMKDMETVLKRLKQFRYTTVNDKPMYGKVHQELDVVIDFVHDLYSEWQKRDRFLREKYGD